MSIALHVLKPRANELALAAIEKDVAAGDEVTVALLAAAAAPPLPDGVTVRRDPDEMTYEELLEAVFAADRVIAW